MTITVGMLSSLVLEAIKVIIRMIKKDNTYDFSEAFYVILIPVLNLLMQPVLVWLGMLDAGSVTLSWELLLSTLIASLVSLISYNAGLKPLKTYARELKAE